jgi:hypothetical protein
MIEVGQNLNQPPLHVRHSELKRVSEESVFRSECPVCKRGYLLVLRDQKTFQLSRYDTCTFCGQPVIYSDRDIEGFLLYPMKDES